MAEHRRTQPLARDAMAYVLAGGRGSRLKELTDRRAKPAVYFGGKTRIIDFALSNALNSGIRRIGGGDPVQGAQPDPPPAARLELLPPERNESFDILPASQRVSETQWYEGTADAVFQNIDIIEELRAALHGHPRGRPHLQDGLRGDAAPARRLRRRRDRRLPRGAAHGGTASASCMSTRRDRITAFVEKPADPPGIPGQAGHGARLHGHLRLRDAKFLIDQLRRDAADARLEPRFRQGHHPLHRPERKAVAHRFSRSCVRSDRTRPRPTGATSARSTPTGRPTST
jgi:glucose-1-phosphate adenylyltransferase